MEEEQGKQSLFPNTRWTQVNRAGGKSQLDLDLLIRQYWLPLKVYFGYSFPNLKNDADSWVQDFAEDKILREGWLLLADKNRGKFRNFLKSSLRNFVLDRLKKNKTSQNPVSLHELTYELEAEEASSEAFDLAWVRAILVQALERMENDCKDVKADQPHRTHIWELFKYRILQPAFEGGNPMPYDSLVELFSLRSPSEAANMLFSAKRIFRSHLQEVIRKYEMGDKAVANEIRELEQFLKVLS